MKKGPKKGNIRPESQFKYSRTMTPAERLKYNDELRWLQEEENRLRWNEKETR